MQDALFPIGDGERLPTGPSRSRRTCSTCGRNVGPKSHQCADCRRRGFRPGRLDVDAQPEPSPTLAERTAAIGLGPALVERTEGRRRPQVPITDPAGAITYQVPAAVAADLEPYRPANLTAAERARAHRERCDGPIMAPVFGVGRRSCLACDWSPDDAA